MKLTVSLLVISISLNIYQYYTTSNLVSDIVRTNNSAISKIKRMPTLKKVAKVTSENVMPKKSIFQVSPAELPSEVKEMKTKDFIEQEPTLNEALEDFSKKAAEVNKKFKNDLQFFLEQDLSLNEDDLQAFDLINELKQEEISKLWEKSDKERGNSKIFIPTHEEQMAMMEVKNKYQNKLKKLLGEDGLSRYENYLNGYMEKLLESDKNTILPSF